MKQSKHETQRLIIRPFKLSDYKVWFEAYVERLPKQSKWDLKKYKPSECTKKIYSNILKDYRQLAKKDEYYRYGLFEKNTNKLIGHIDFDIFSRGSLQFANFGYRIHNRYWKQGYGSEASKFGLKIGFEELKLNRLEAAINLDNKISIKLVQKIGMRKEGVRKRYWFENGKWVDHLMYVVNPEDVGLKYKNPLK